jgi:hypothetical protein
MDYTPQELMVAAAAREIRDGEVVFVGMRLPLIAFALARETHAPTAIGLFECGIVRDTPAPELLYTMGDGPNIAEATWCARMIDVIGLMQAGAVHAGFIGGAEIDRYGNLNTSYIGPRERPQRRARRLHHLGRLRRRPRLARARRPTARRPGGGDHHARRAGLRPADEGGVPALLPPRPVARKRARQHRLGSQGRPRCPRDIIADG